MATPKVAQRPRFLAPGDKLGKYDLIRQIAVGGMAELYLARTVGIEGFEKLVVLKRILPQYMANQQFVGMFLNEARLAATLQHPNIAQVYDIGVEEGDYFFAMEYIHGEDLGRLLATGHEHGVAMPLDAAITLVAGLCAGLHYAHDKADADGKPLGVVHRDVSPSNVLVSYDGGVKLVDFGIARASSHNTTQGGLKGKIAYMSPEQCRGKTVLDRRSDVFSIGSVLFELTTGRVPFVDETEFGILNQIVTTDAPKPSTIVPNYPPVLEKIVMRALSRDLDARYPTAQALQVDLEEFAHENRLRVSPLVLARVMSSLFPARLEEWEHARKQGAFFVEQHVLQTLINGKHADGMDGPNPHEEDATGVDTQITEIPVADRDRDPETGTRIPTAQPPAVDESIPIPTAIAAPWSRNDSEPLPLPSAPTPPPSPRIPTGMPLPRAQTNPGMHRTLTPVPNMPGAVPIIAAFTPPADAHAMPAPPMAMVEVEPAPARSSGRGKVIALAAIAAMVLGGVIVVVTRGGGKSTSPTESAGGAKSTDDDSASGSKPDETGGSTADGTAGTKAGDDTAAAGTEARPTGAADTEARPTGAAGTEARPTGAAGTEARPTGATTTADGSSGSTAKAGTSAEAGTTARPTTGTADSTAKAGSTAKTGAAGKAASKPTSDDGIVVDDTPTKPIAKKPPTGTVAKKQPPATKSPPTTDKKGSAWKSDSIFLPVRSDKH